MRTLQCSYPGDSKPFDRHRMADEWGYREYMLDLIVPNGKFCVELQNICQHHSGSLSVMIVANIPRMEDDSTTICVMLADPTVPKWTVVESHIECLEHKVQDAVETSRLYSMARDVDDD